MLDTGCLRYNHCSNGVYNSISKIVLTNKFAFLDTGDSYTSLSYLYRVSRQCLGQIIPETCTAIYDALSPVYTKVSNCESVYLKL